LTTSLSTGDVASKGDVPAGEIALAGLQDGLEILPRRIEPRILEATDQGRPDPVDEAWITMLTGDIVELTIRTPTLQEENPFLRSLDERAGRDLELIINPEESPGQDWAIIG
jgi:hypothetical protein